MMTVACPFCNIASGKAEASIVYQDDNILALMALNPSSVGHTLVIPRKHWENIYEVPEKTLGEIAAVVKRVSVAVKKTVGADGIKLIQLNGKAAGQVVMHIHFHVIPIISNSGAAVGQRGRINTERNELDEIAKKIQENL